MTAEAPVVLPAAREPEIQVEAYRGPFDLLLHLIKEEEVDIFDIPIARILERYLAELARIETVDINAAADFILLAATLMEIKSRQMLPPEEREALEPGEEGDPRADLVRELLDYRRFREAADELGGFAARRALLFGRAAFGQGLDLDEPAADPGEELREVGLYDLMAAFEALMKAIMADVPRTIVYDDISVEERIEELKLRLTEKPEPVRFSELSRDAADRADAAGILIAVLEATRRKLVTVLQAEALGELYVSLRGDAPDAQFAPPEGEQPGQLSEAEMVARRGVFGDFVATGEEEEDDAAEFAVDREGRQAIARLEQASARAEDVIRRVGRQRDAQPGTDGGLPPGVQAPGEPPPAADGRGPQQVMVRQWTDPDRTGRMVTIGGVGAALLSPRRFGRAVLAARSGFGRVGRRSLAPGAVPRRTLRRI